MSERAADRADLLASSTAEGMDLENSSRHIRIEPSRGWAPLNVRELIKYRQLLYFFAWRDIKIRYKQTIMGASWAILQPLFTMAVFSIFFGRLAKVPSDGIPYPIFSYAALVPWTFFANSVTLGANTLVMGSNMVKKIYFPRITMPIATVLAGVVDFVLAFIVLIGMMAYYGFVPTANLIWLPLFLFLALISALGAVLWLSALNVQFRDVRYATPFLIQAWLFLTPIAYSSSLLEGPAKTVYGLNPMAGVVDGFRWALLGSGSPPGPMVLVSSIAALVVLTTGAYYFRKMESRFADII